MELERMCGMLAGEDAVAVGPGREAIPGHVRRHRHRLCRPLSPPGHGCSTETDPQVQPQVTAALQKQIHRYSLRSRLICKATGASPRVTAVCSIEKHMYRGRGNTLKIHLLGSRLL
jgi:hypothetical protein